MGNTDGFIVNKFKAIIGSKNGACTPQLKASPPAITGIALPAGSDKLISGSIDGTVRAWDCNTGRCVNMIHLNSQVTEEGTLEVTYTHTNQIVIGCFWTV
ncbi:hypothetical protein HN51_011287 [Arachis hypogaea]